MKKFIFGFIASLFILHLTAQPTYADWGLCLPPWGCPPSAPAPAAKPAAPVSAAWDFLQFKPKQECTSSGLKVYLKWEPSVNATDYEVHKRKQGETKSLGTPATKIYEAPQSAFRTSWGDIIYTDNQVTQETTYEYLIKAINNAGDNTPKFSDFGDIEQIYTQTCDPTAVSKAEAEAYRQQLLTIITEQCTYNGKPDQLCIDNATNDCLAEGRYADTEKISCIAGWTPNVPGDFSLYLPKLLCSAGSPVVRLVWEYSANAENYTVFRNLNNKGFEQVSSGRAALYNDRDIPEDFLTATYRVGAVSSAGFEKSSKIIKFPPAGTESPLIKKIQECRAVGRVAGIVPDTGPTTDPNAPVATSTIDLSVSREYVYGQEFDKTTEHVYSPEEKVNLGAKIFNKNLNPSDPKHIGCPIVPVEFEVAKINDDGSEQQIHGPVTNQPVCKEYSYTMPKEEGEYVFRVKFAGEGNLGAAPDEPLRFRVVDKAEVKNYALLAHINGETNPEPIYADSPHFDGKLNIGARFFKSDDPQKACKIIEAGLSLTLERVRDEKFKELIDTKVSGGTFDDATNCYSYTVQLPTDRSGNVLTGWYKLTAQFRNRGKTAVKDLDATSAIEIKGKGFEEAIMRLSIEGTEITQKPTQTKLALNQKKPKGQVAGISVQRIGDKLILKTDPQSQNSEITANACATPVNDPNNTTEISLARIVLTKKDTSGNLSEIFNDVVPNCLRQTLSLGDTSDADEYYIIAKAEDDRFPAAIKSSILDVPEVAAQAAGQQNRQINISVGPDASTITSLHEPKVLVYTNFIPKNPQWIKVVNGQTEKSPAMPFGGCPADVTNLCIYSLAIPTPNGNYDVKFCSDDICSEPIVFDTNKNAERSAAPVTRKVTAVEFFLHGQRVDLVSPGGYIDLALVPETENPTVLQMALHYSDGTTSPPVSVNIYFEEATGGPTAQPAPTELPTQSLVCTRGEFERVCTGACGGCGPDAGEARISQCRADGSGFDEQGGECRSECAGPCQTTPEAVPASACEDVYYPDPAGLYGCTRKYSPDPTNCNWVEFDTNVPDYTCGANNPGIE